jgi:hypothetical protein
VPGVRVRVSSRRVRTSVGPRAARVHVGGSRTTISSGVRPVTVWSTAFADNASTAAALSVDGSALAVLMIQPAADELGDQKAALTPGGNPTITRMTKTEQRQLWTACTLSRAVATISEAFAVAPGIQRVNIAVVSNRLASSTRYSLVLAGEAPRNYFRHAQWPNQINTSDLARGGNFIFDLDRFGALSEIPTNNDPHLRALVDGINGVIDQDENGRADLPSSEPPRTHIAPTPDRRALTPSPAPRAEHTHPAETSPTVATPAGPTASPEGRPFVLWGRGISYANIEIKGTEHRQDAILSLLPRRGLRDGADLDTTAQLIPEPTNPFDANAIGCWVQGRLIGYLPREDAARYAAPLTQFVRSGRLPTTNVHVWAREFADYDYDGIRETKTKRY